MPERRLSFKRFVIQQRSRRYTTVKETGYVFFHYRLGLVDPDNTLCHRSQVEDSVINPSRDRGEHDIEYGLVFESNQGFIFHDSRGFEAGGRAELYKARNFVIERSEWRKLDERVHAIWYIVYYAFVIVCLADCALRYCIPMDDDRPFTIAETTFFDECGTGDGK